MTKYTKRMKSREILIRLVFQADAQHDYSHEVKDLYLSGEDIESLEPEYIDEVFDLIAEHLEEIDEILNRASSNWKTSRMSKIDLAVLRTAAAEILYYKDVPVSVAVNEAVNLAKIYGTDDSYKFINGVLGKVVRITKEKKQDTAPIENKDNLPEENM